MLSNLGISLLLGSAEVCLTFNPYCNFAIIGLSEMKVKSLRRHVNGRGTIKAIKMTISATNKRKTWTQNKNK